MKCLFGVALVAATVLASTSAQASGLGVEGNAARSYGQWGGELGLGYRARIGIFDITPEAGAFIFKGDDRGYFNTTDKDGTKHCRAPNGQFADKDKCNRVAAKAYGKLEAGITIPVGVRFAVGGRYIGSELQPYGAASMKLMPKLSVKVNGGPHYGAAGLTFGF